MQPITTSSAVLDGQGNEDDDTLGHRQVGAFLTKCDLQRYYSTFIDEGFDQLEALFEVTELDLEQMGVKRGHRRLLQRAISNARNVPLVSSFVINTVVPDQPNVIPDDDHPRRSSQQQPVIMSHHASISSVSGAQSSSMSSAEDDTITSENVTRCWKRKYERHPTPDKNAPIKPPSAYVMFCNYLRAELKNENLSFPAFAKIAGVRWKSLDTPDKQVYERQAQQAKDEYKAALEQYKHTQEYRQYEQYLNDFREKHETAARSVGKPHKRSRRKRRWSDSPSSTAPAPPTPPARTGYPYYLLNPSCTMPSSSSSSIHDSTK
ncbi:HMG-box [Lichtheimia hyalospora FSU 10163]|nr:HMG-box [Lichtheimia hyalospora FSU 10163]